MEHNIKYIQENFIEWEELCSASNISSRKLENLIDKKLVPNPSYTIHSTDNISSPLGDSIVIKTTKKYFPKHTKELIEKNRNRKNSIEFRNKLKEDFFCTLKDNPDKKYAYNNILNENGSIDVKKLDLAFEKEWKAYCQGIYGICTLHGTGNEIAKKEIAVKKLIEFNTTYKDKNLTENEKETLKKLNLEYNEVSNLFAPYQRAGSSRGKYLDKILESNSLSELIKDYN